MITTVIILALLTALVATDEHANASITPGEDYPDKELRDLRRIMQL